MMDAQSSPMSEAARADAAALSAKDAEISRLMAALNAKPTPEAILSRSEHWPGPKPTIDKNRKMCADCKFHEAALAGWPWDRCHHPEADHGSVVRNDTPRCCDMRESEAQCGLRARWYSPRKANVSEA